MRVSSQRYQSEQNETEQKVPFWQLRGSSASKNQAANTSLYSDINQDIRQTGTRSSQGKGKSKQKHKQKETQNFQQLGFSGLSPDSFEDGGDVWQLLYQQNSAVEPEGTGTRKAAPKASRKAKFLGGGFFGAAKASRVERGRNSTDSESQLRDSEALNQSARGSWGSWGSRGFRDFRGFDVDSKMSHMPTGSDSASGRPLADAEGFRRSNASSASSALGGVSKRLSREHAQADEASGQGSDSGKVYAEERFHQVVQEQIEAAKRRDDSVGQIGSSAAVGSSQGDLEAELLQAPYAPSEGFWESLARASQWFLRSLRLEGLLFLLQLAAFSLLVQHYLPPLSRYYFDHSASLMLRPDDLEQMLSDDILLTENAQQGPKFGAGAKKLASEALGGGEQDFSGIALAAIDSPFLQNDSVELSKEQLDAVLKPEYLTKTYTVQNGESISLLAQRHHLKMSTLISVNHIERAKNLRAGQQVLIPNMDGLLYEVGRGDTLKSIAKQYETSIGSLIDANQLESETLVAGSQIFVPGATLSSRELREVFGNLFIYPFKGRLSSGFGYRRNPFRARGREFHNGIDIVGPRGSPVKASSDGVVVAAGYHHSIFGRYVILQHDKGIKTLYGHLSKISVRKGQKVVQGSAIGLIGTTGRSTGPHVHFTIFVGGKAVNPLDYLNK